MSTWSTNLKIELITSGDQSGTWGTTTNTNLGTALEQAIVGKADVTMSSTTVTLSLTNTNALQNARAAYLNLTGTPGGAATLEVPAIEKPYIVKNGTNQTVTIKVTGLTGVVIPTGKTTIVYTNGTDVVSAIDHIPSLTLGAALPVASGGTGQTSYTTGDILYASSSTVLAKLAGVATGSALISGGVGTAPSWGKIGLTTHVSGTLPVANGGTGSTSTTYCSLTSNVTGTLPVANGGTGVTTSTGTGAVVLSTSPTFSGTVGFGITPAATVRVTTKGSDSTSGNFALQAVDSSENNLFYIRNDGLVNTGLRTNSPYNLITSDLPNAVVTSGGNLARSNVSSTGTGDIVRATSPTLTTPILGTPSAATLTNATGLPIVGGTTGTLSVARGGTGATSLTANNVVLGNGTSAVQFVAPGSSGNVLTSNGTTWTSAAPAVSSVNGLTGAVSMTGLGDIGSYAVLIIATNTNVAAGSTVAGSDLRHSWTPNQALISGGFAAYTVNRSRASTGTYDGGGTSLTGSWRKMSTGVTYVAYVDSCTGDTTYFWCAALYVRIS